MCWRKMELQAVGKTREVQRQSDTTLAMVDWMHRVTFSSINILCQHMLSAASIHLACWHQSDKGMRLPLFLTSSSLGHTF